MTVRWPDRLVRAARIMAALAVMAIVAVWWPTPRISAQSSSQPFELDGTGAYEAVAQFTALSRPFFDADRPLSLSYIGDGDRDGRGALIRGDAAFAISGRPMSGDDEAALKAAGKGVIEAPFALTSIAMVMSAPNPGLLDPLHPPGIQTADLSNPNDPDSPIIFKDVPGPFRLTNDMVGKAFLLNQGPWNTPDLNAMIAQQFNGSSLMTYDRPLASVARSDPGAFNYYLEQYLKVGSPTAWATAAATGMVPTDTQSESWPFLFVPTRAGDSALGALLGGWQDPLSGSPPKGGVIGPVSAATAADQFRQQVQKAGANPPQPPTPLYSVAIQNGAGEFIAPTPANLTATAAMGDGKPLYGLTEDAPGAYPLTYVNDIFVPDSGLSVDQTNGVATLMRVQAGAGQSLEFALGEGKLPADLTQKTLDGADQVVRANCKGDDRTIQTVTGGGQFWPKSVAPPAKSLVCVATPQATETSGGGGGGSAQFADGGTGSGALGSASTGDLASSSAVDGATSPSASAGGGTSASSGGSNGKSAGGGSVEGVLAEMPLPPPNDGRYLLDRLSTLLLGGAAFLVVRKVLRSRSAQ